MFQINEFLTRFGEQYQERKVLYKITKKLRRVA